MEEVLKVVSKESAFLKQKLEMIIKKTHQAKNCALKSKLLEFLPKGLEQQKG